jgi:hypothetical protein
MPPRRATVATACPTLASKKAIAKESPAAYGQLTRRRKFIQACMTNATKNGVIELDHIAVKNGLPAMTTQHADRISKLNPANTMRFSKQFLIVGAAGAAQVQMAAAGALTPLVDFSKRKTVNARCYVAAKAVQLAFERAAGSDTAPDLRLSEIIVNAVASDSAKNNRGDPLDEFDDADYDLAVEWGGEYLVSEKDIRLACVRLLSAPGKWSE